jgi:hypothetical protein
MNSSNSVIVVLIPATAIYLHLQFDVMSSFVFRVDTGFPKGQFPVQEIIPKVYEMQSLELVLNRRQLNTTTYKLNFTQCCRQVKKNK